LAWSPTFAMPCWRERTSAAGELKGRMSIIFLLIPLSVVIATGFLFAFIWAVRSGQYEDTKTPSMRLLFQDLPPVPEKPRPNEAAPEPLLFTPQRR
jgi:cbb3-type cytochrome oxidase maturation protein